MYNKNVTIYILFTFTPCMSEMRQIYVTYNI